jgi:hypothetical protein
MISRVHLIGTAFNLQCIAASTKVAEISGEVLNGDGWQC